MQRCKFDLLYMTDLKALIIMNCIIIIWGVLLYLSTFDGTYLGSGLFWVLVLGAIYAVKWVLVPILIHRALWFVFVLSWICISKIDTGLDHLLEPLNPRQEACQRTPPLDVSESIPELSV